jgi:hypothetical protein
MLSGAGKLAQLGAMIERRTVKDQEHGPDIV